MNSQEASTGFNSAHKVSQEPVDIDTKTQSQQAEKRNRWMQQMLENASGSMQMEFWTHVCACHVLLCVQGRQRDK